MKRNVRKILVITALICACIIGTVVADPGTNADPLISKSYIDSVVMPQLERLIESKIAGLGGNSGNVSASKFVVVEAAAGKEIICDAGTELVLRMGSATIIATQKGGLADTTIGYDLANGVNMPSNHHMIVPVADGRGIRANTNIIVLIKGGYSIR